MVLKQQKTCFELVGTQKLSKCVVFSGLMKSTYSTLWHLRCKTYVILPNIGGTYASLAFYSYPILTNLTWVYNALFSTVPFFQLFILHKRIDTCLILFLPFSQIFGFFMWKRKNGLKLQKSISISFQVHKHLKAGQIHKCGHASN